MGDNDTTYQPHAHYEKQFVVKNNITDIYINLWLIYWCSVDWLLDTICLIICCKVMLKSMTIMY